MPSLRIVLGDDHTLMRQGLRKILEEQPDWQVVAQASDGREAVRQVLAQRPDVAVLDIGMPQLNGIEATAQIARRAPDVRILILSMHADDAYVVRAVKAGARGYLLKDSADTDLIRAVVAVSSGQSFFSPRVASFMLDDYVRRLSAEGLTDPFETLTEREREVLQLAAEGRSNKEIAELLCISATTVETHRARVLQKLNLHSIAELVLYAVRRGVVA
jgi:two-component system response regulator NreC